MSSQQQTARRLSSAFQQGVTRRRFLKWGLVGSAGVAAAAAGGFALLRLSPLDDRPKPDWADGLSRQEYHLFDRARVALLPTVGTDLTPSDQVPVVRNVQGILGFMDAATRKVFFHGKRFVDLDEATARDYFDAWSRGNVVQRTLGTVIKQLTYTSYWRDESTWGPVEFDGPVSDRWGIAYLGNAPLPDQQSEQATEEGNA